MYKNAPSNIGSSEEILKFLRTTCYRPGKSWWPSKSTYLAIATGQVSHPCQVSLETSTPNGVEKKLKKTHRMEVGEFDSIFSWNLRKGRKEIREKRKENCAVRVEERKWSVAK